MEGHEEASLEESWGKSIPGRASSTCKGPEAGRLGVLKEEQGASVAGMEGVRGTMVRHNLGNLQESCQALWDVMRR